MQTDVQIAQAATLQPIAQIAAQLGIAPDDLEQYGKYKAKINPAMLSGCLTSAASWCW